MNSSGPPASPSPSQHSLVRALEDVAGRSGGWIKGAAGIVALVASALVGVAWWWLLVAAVAATIGVLTEIGQQKWQERDRVRRQADAVATEVASARAETRAARTELELTKAGLRKYTLLVDTFDPIARGIASMGPMSPGRRRAAFERLAKATVDAVLLVHSVAGLRAVLYQVAPGGDSILMVDWGSHGHRTDPGHFDRGTVRGDKAFQTLHHREVLFVDDIRTAPETWAGSGEGYQTFITCPIFAGSREFGLLTVDAPFTDDLTEDDKNGLRLVASLISQAFALRGA